MRKEAGRWMRQVAFSGVLCALAPAAFAQSAPELPEGVVSHTVERPYDDVRFDMENAIINRGLVIDHVSHIGEMLARTGADVGSDKVVFANADAMMFCSARLSRAAMEASAGNIAFCPYVVFAFETPDAPGRVTVGFRKLEETGSDASRKALADVNALLSEIVAEAAGEEREM
ncbi:MAG: DUF302 domain-containing protein [Stappia sp.]|uniref:DUF302 domain-containing protein n=1 Tax=Stappia sp. TaxID=1870903 RepID=UPI000C4F0892|nr:DUF302 domain-containing protein [Stappia sp.]MBM20961.1 DUF302 domain-containing protein [Stappia sp.]